MLGHFGARFEVFGRRFDSLFINWFLRFDSRSRYGAEKKLSFVIFFGFLLLGSVWLKVGPGFDSGCRQGQVFHFFFNLVVWGSVHG